MKAKRNGEQVVSKDMEKVTKAMEKVTDTVVNTFVDRVVDRVDQIEPMVEKGKKSLKNMTEITIDGISTVIDAAADHWAGIVNKEVSLETEKKRAKATVETLIEKTGEYIEVVAESVSGDVEKTEEIVKKDMEAAKDVYEELIENYHNLKKY